MNDNVKDFNEFAKKHGARKEVWDEDLKFKYMNKSLREYIASIYGLAYQKFPIAAFTNESVYLQWCMQLSGMMPDKRKSEFHRYMQERVAEATEAEILPGLEEGAIIKQTVLHHVRSQLGIEVDADPERAKAILEAKKTEAGKAVRTIGVRDLDDPKQPKDIGYREPMFLETRDDTGFGEKAVFIRIDPLMDWITERARHGLTEAKIDRDTVCNWLAKNGKHYPRNASPARLQSVYALRLSFVWAD
jgi:hypothetical protein